jgi:hypothetical protein
MRRAALAVFVLSACLSPGDPLYDRMDTLAPTVDFALTRPQIFGPDAGLPLVQAGQTIEVAFSETMDARSLRPGIVIRKDRDELPLLIQAPEPVLSQSVPSTLPYVVRVAAGESTFASGVHTMTLRTLLVDVAGNPLEAEVTGFFRVP